MQKVIVGFLIVLSAIYLIQRMAKKFKKSSQQGGCGGCSDNKNDS